MWVTLTYVLVVKLFQELSLAQLAHNIKYVLLLHTWHRAILREDFGGSLNVGILIDFTRSNCSASLLILPWWELPIHYMLVVYEIIIIIIKHLIMHSLSSTEGRSNAHEHTLKIKLNLQMLA